MDEMSDDDKSFGKTYAAMLVFLFGILVARGAYDYSEDLAFFVFMGAVLSAAYVFERKGENKRG